jgi:hypothetical protein
MSTPTENYARSLLHKMAEHVDAIADEPVLTRKFARLSFNDLSSRLVMPTKIGGITDSYAAWRLANMRTRLRKEYSISGDELKRAAAELIIWSMVQTHSKSLSKERPLLHHWLPLCYTKAFAHEKLTSARGVRIAGIRFDADGDIVAKTLIKDTYFAHAKTAKGYYPPYLEKFFARIETFYGEEMNLGKVDNAWTRVVMFAFFAVQSARHPVKDSLKRNHISGLMQNVFATIDVFDDPHVSYANGCHNLLFAPFFPPRFRMTVNGVYAQVFPISPSQGVVITNAEIDESEAYRLAHASLESMKVRAGKQDEALFGQHAF